MTIVQLYRNRLQVAFVTGILSPLSALWLFGSLYEPEQPLFTTLLMASVPLLLAAAAIITYRLARESWIADGGPQRYGRR